MFFYTILSPSVFTLPSPPLPLIYHIFLLPDPHSPLFSSLPFPSLFSHSPYLPLTPSLSSFLPPHLNYSLILPLCPLSACLPLSRPSSPAVYYSFFLVLSLPSTMFLAFYDLSSTSHSYFLALPAPSSISFSYNLASRVTNLSEKDKPSKKNPIFTIFPLSTSSSVHVDEISSETCMHV